MKHPVGQTKSGIPVYVDLIHSKAAEHIAGQPHLLGLVQEVLQETAAHEPEMSIEYDMGRVIGYNFVVDTTEKDTVFYAQLLRDDTYTRFVKNGEPRSTQYLTVVLKRDEEGNYELYDTWIGNVRPPRPGTANETPESKPFWTSHAVVLANQNLQARTVTKVCPY